MTLISMAFRWVAALSIVLCGGFASFASAAGPAFFNGQAYEPLTQWAAANGFSAQTRNLGRELILTDDATRLVFEVNSAQAEINGINVRLSFPVACQGNLLYLSKLDLGTLVRPLVDPPRSPAKRVMTICLDPGHGGKDSGNRVGSGLFAHNEKTYTLQLALALRKELADLGFHVILTRTRDMYVPLPARPALANDRDADLFVSLHFNASQEDPAAVAGPETYCITPVGARSSNDHGEGSDNGAGASGGPTVANRSEPQSLLLAYEMEKALVQNLHTEDRGVRRARFAVLRDARMPAILIEGGYMTNPAEGRKIYSPAYRQQMADAITKGILNYLRITEPGALVRGRSSGHTSRLTHLAENGARSANPVAEQN